MRLTKSRRADLICAAIITVVIWFQWSLTLGIFMGQRMSEPVSLGGDAHYTAAIVAAARRSDFWPFASKVIPSLGAPFKASWNDFPMTEDWVYFGIGQLAKVFGTFGAINLGYLFGCIVAGLSFYYVARRFRLRRPFATMAAIMFGFSNFVVCRGVHHFSLTFFWVVPWQVLVATWLASRHGIPFRSKKFYLSVAVCIVTGWSVIYFTFFAAQLFALGLIVRLFRPKPLKGVPIALVLAVVSGLSVLSVSADSLLFWRANGVNERTITRAPTDIEFYALKPIALFVPATNHKFPFFHTLALKANDQSMIQAEIPSPYLGMIQNIMLLSLIAAAAMAIAKRKLTFAVTWAFTVAWLLIGHSVGGENSLMGLAGMRLFRSVNRVSIVILAYVLLFGAWGLPRLLRANWPKAGPRTQWAIAMLLALFGTWEPIPAVNNPAQIAANRRVHQSDLKLVAEADAALPKGSLVFQLPPMDFPEVGWVGSVETYEMFRPYFYSDHLIFSHGDDKGRANAQWKFRVASQPPAQLIAELKQNGFSALYVNLKGYPGQEQLLVNTFVAAGARIVAQAEAGDSLFFAL